MNGKILNDILKKIVNGNCEGTVIITTKTGESYNFEVSKESSDYSFDDAPDKSVIRIWGDEGTKWIDCDSIVSVEI